MNQWKASLRPYFIAASIILRKKILLGSSGGSSWYCMVQRDTSDEVISLRTSKLIDRRATSGDDTCFGWNWYVLVWHHKKIWELKSSIIRNKKNKWKRNSFEAFLSKVGLFLICHFMNLVCIRKSQDQY